MGIMYRYALEEGSRMKGPPRKIVILDDAPTTVAEKGIYYLVIKDI